MTSKACPQICVVDDEPVMLEAACHYLGREDYQCHCFEAVDECLEHIQRHGCDLLVTDYQMPDKTGLDLLEEIKRVAPWVPVLFMSAYGDIPLAVRAVKAGAVNFIEKPFDRDELLDVVRNIITQHRRNLRKGKPLTKVENAVLEMVLQNKTNRKIAQILHRSVRTVEVHRNHIMQKLDVHNVVDLVKRASEMDWDRLARKKDQQ